MNEKLTAYVLNELPPDERAELEAQMKIDPALREQAEEMKTFCAMLSAEMAAEESPALTAQQRVSVMRAFTTEMPQKKIVRPFWRHPAFLVPAAIAACVAFAMVRDGRRTESEYAPLAASTDSAKEKQLSLPVQVSQLKADRKAPAPSMPKPAPAAPEKPRVEVAAAPAPALPTVAMADVKKEEAPAAGQKDRLMKIADRSLKVGNPVPATPAAPPPPNTPTYASTNAPGNRGSTVKDASGQPLASASRPAASKAIADNSLTRSSGSTVLKSDAPAPANVQYATQWAGTFIIRTAGAYTFLAKPDDACRVYVDGVPVLNYDGGKGKQEVASALVNLATGRHDIRVECIRDTAGVLASLTYAGPDTGVQTGQAPNGGYARVAMNSTNAALKQTEISPSNASAAAMQWGNAFQRSAGSTINFTTNDDDSLSLGRSAILSRGIHLEDDGAIAANDFAGAPGILGTWERSRQHLESAPYPPEALDAGNGNFVGAMTLSSGALRVEDHRIVGVTKSGSGAWVLGGANGFTRVTGISISGDSVATRDEAPLALNDGKLRFSGFAKDKGIIGANGSPVTLSEHNQIADSATIHFDTGLAVVSASNGANNSYFQVLGFSESIGSLADSTGSGVIENMEGGKLRRTLTEQRITPPVDPFAPSQSLDFVSGGRPGQVILGATAAGTVVSSGDVLEGGGIATRTFTVNDGVYGDGHGAAGAASRTTQPTAVSDVNITAGGGVTFRNGNGATAAPAMPTSTTFDDGRFGNGVAVAGGFTKSGAGSSNLDNTNTYTGATTVSAGTLRVINGFALGGTGGVAVAQEANASTPTAVTSPGGNVMNAATVTTKSGQAGEVTAIHARVTATPADNKPATLNSLRFANPASVETPEFQTANISGAANSLTADGGTLELVGANSGASMVQDTRQLSGNATFGGTVTLNSGAVITASRSAPATAAAAASAAPMAADKDIVLATDKKKENTWTGTINGTISGAGNAQAIGGTMDLNGVSAVPPSVGRTFAGAGDIYIADEFNTYTGTPTTSAGTLSVASARPVAPAQLKATNGILPWAVVDESAAGKATSFAAANSATPAAPSAEGHGVTVMSGERITLAPGTNTYSGTTIVNQGTLTVGNSSSASTPSTPLASSTSGGNALGDFEFQNQPNLTNGIVGGWAVIDNRPSLELQGGVPVGGEALSMNGTVVGGASPNLIGDSSGLGAVSPRTVTVNAGQTFTVNSSGIVPTAAAAAPSNTLALANNDPVRFFNNSTVVSAPLVDNPTVTIQIAPGPPSEQELLERKRAKLAEKNAELRRHLYELEQRNAEIARRETSNETYTHIYENPFLFVAQQPLSTFSIDVDSASYANVRRFLNNGQCPPPDAVRLEELINYFPYAYEGPGDGKPFGVMVDVAEAPWQPLHRLVRVALKGREVKEERGTANFVFLVDVSGSMSSDDKLPLVKKSLQMLTRQLGKDDRVALVVYAGNSGLVLPSTPGTDRDTILEAIGRMQAGGSTNGAGGITQAYQEAAKHFVKGGVNRVILCTDGDFNVGISSPEELEHLIAEKAKSRIFLSVLGFGTGNLKDRTMETLADKGNGNYAYIDSLGEARKVLVEQMNGTLVTIAKDVKIQVEFNPAQVAAYRLLGYENRLMAKEDFNNDKKDAGEIGAGHTVTALYEVVPASVKYPDGKPAVDDLKYAPNAAKPTEVEALKPNAPASNEMMTVKLRYKQPEGDKSDLLEVPVTDKEKKLADSEKDFQFAASVAGFGMLLRGSQHAGELTWDMVREMALSGKGEDKLGYRGEFLQLIDRARGLVEPRR